MHSSGRNGGIPQLEALPPTRPLQSRVKKWQNQQFFGKFLDFCPPPDMCFAPPIPPHKNSGVPTENAANLGILCGTSLDEPIPTYVKFSMVRLI